MPKVTYFCYKNIYLFKFICTTKIFKYAFLWLSQQFITNFTFFIALSKFCVAKKNLIKISQNKIIRYLTDTKERNLAEVSCFYLSNRLHGSKVAEGKLKQLRRVTLEFS